MADVIGSTLAGANGVAAVRRLAVDPSSDVRRRIAELVPSADGPELDLIRTKYKPSRKLTATYVVSGDPERHVTVIWTNDDVQVHASPHDPAMPHVAALHDPAHLSDLLGFAGRIETLRFRPGQRHVLRFSGTDRTAFVKVDKDDSGARSVPLAAMLGPRIADQVPGALLAEPIGWSADDRAALWQGAPGRSLREHLDDSSAAASVRLVGAAVRVLHDTPLDLVQPPTTRGVDAEVASTIRAGEHIAALLPAVGADTGAIIADAVGQLGEVPTEPARLAHGDLKTDNVLVHDGTVRLLDLDRCGATDPALDLAKLVVDLRWWTSATTAEALIEAFREGYGPADPARWERAALLTRLVQLKLAARRCAVHDPAWESDVRHRVDAASPVPTGGAR